MAKTKSKAPKENINFLTRTMLAYIAGVYLLAGAVGNFWRTGLRGIFVAVMGTILSGLIADW